MYLAIIICSLSSCQYIPEICYAIEEINEVVQNPHPPEKESVNAISKG
jgi:hypothetical protein